MKNRNNILDFCWMVVLDYFPSEIASYELFAEDNIRLLENGEDILNDTREKNVEFESGKSVSEVLNFLSLLTATYQTVALSEQKHGITLDLRKVFSERLNEAGIEKEISVEISLKYSELLIKDNLEKIREYATARSKISMAKEFLEKNEIEKVFETILEIEHQNEKLNDLSLVRSRYENLKGQFAKGMMNISEYNTSLNEIRNAILILINSIELIVNK